MSCYTSQLKLEQYTDVSVRLYCKMLQIPVICIQNKSQIQITKVKTSLKSRSKSEIHIIYNWKYLLDAAGIQICRDFKIHDLITCKSKVQGVIFLGHHWELFALGRHWVLTNDTWHVFLQSGNVFELGGITNCFRRHCNRVLLFWGVNKQLLNEVEHCLCYLPKPKAEADNTDTRFW